MAPAIVAPIEAIRGRNPRTGKRGPQTKNDEVRCPGSPTRAPGLTRSPAVPNAQMSPLSSTSCPHSALPTFQKTADSSTSGVCFTLFSYTHPPARIRSRHRTLKVTKVTRKCTFDEQIFISALWQTGHRVARECAPSDRNWEGGMRATIHSDHPPENVLLCKNIMRTLGSGFAWSDGEALEALERI
jgi:hypothetical protein